MQTRFDSTAVNMKNRFIPVSFNGSYASTVKMIESKRLRMDWAFSRHAINEGCINNFK
jgi:hypothetical protein